MNLLHQYFWADNIYEREHIVLSYLQQTLQSKTTHHT